MTVTKSACDLPLPQPPVKNVAFQRAQNTTNTCQQTLEKQLTSPSTCQPPHEQTPDQCDPETRDANTVSQSSELFIRQLLEELSVSNYYEELSSEKSACLSNSDNGYGSVSDDYETIPSTMENNSIYSHIYQYLVPSDPSVYDSEGSLCSKAAEKISQIYEEIYSIIHSGDNNSLLSEKDIHSESSDYEEITSRGYYAIRSLPTPKKCPSENTQQPIQRVSSESTVLCAKKPSQLNTTGPEYLVPKIIMNSEAQKDGSLRFDRKNLLRKPLRSKQIISEAKKTDVLNVLKSGKVRNMIARESNSTNFHGKGCEYSLGKDKAKHLVKNVVYWNETSL